MKRRRRKGRALLAVGLVLLAAVLAAGAGWLFFRPQLTAAARRVRDWLTAPKAETAFRHYQDGDGKTVIWLDPGHGGTDPGAVSDYLGEETESSINYRLSRLLKTRLEALGYTVRLAWEEDTPTDERGQYPYQERIARANADPEADLYLCLHCNSFTDASAKGPRLYYCPARSPYNYYLAVSVADAIGTAHGMAEERPRLFAQEEESAFYVLKTAEMPAFLLETLFVSHPEDAAKLLDPDWLAAEADGLAAGVRAFLEPVS